MPIWSKLLHLKTTPVRKAAAFHPWCIEISGVFCILPFGLVYSKNKGPFGLALIGYLHNRPKPETFGRQTTDDRVAFCKCCATARAAPPCSWAVWRLYNALYPPFCKSAMRGAGFEEATGMLNPVILNVKAIWRSLRIT